MPKKTFVIDTNILVTDPNSLYSFENSEIILPFTIIEELDKLKSRPNEVGANARETARILSDLINFENPGELSRGVSIGNGNIIRVIAVSDFELDDKLSKDWDQTNKDNHIIDICRGLTAQYKEEGKDPPILLTQDIILRVKCDVLGIPSIYYKNDLSIKKAENKDYLFTGITTIDVPNNIIQAYWEAYGTQNKDFGFPVKDYYNGPLYPNQFIILNDPSSNDNPILRYMGDDIPMKIIKERKAPICNISPRNKEQNLALDLLMDDNIKLVTLTGRAGTGKAQPLTSQVLTPDGYKFMKDIKIGDLVVGSDGKNTEVIGEYPQESKKEIYKVIFDDKSVVECCPEHLWNVYTLQDKRKKTSKVLMTKEILFDLSNNSYFIDTVKPISFKQKDNSLPIHPYIIGALLGDGSLEQYSTTITTSDKEIVENFNSLLPENYTCSLKNKKGLSFAIINKDNIGNKKRKDNEFNKKIKELELCGLYSYNKFIPKKYLISTIENRILLLQGLMDTDGFVSLDGSDVVYTTQSEHLKNDVCFLVNSLGGRSIPHYVNKQWFDLKSNKKRSGMYWNISISFDQFSGIVPFRLKRKIDRFKPRKNKLYKKIIDIIPTNDFVEMKCISVQNNDHLYITNGITLTHNTLISLAAGLEQVLEKKKYKSLLICRPVVPVGNDLGYLPGNLAEKLEPWLSPLKDSLRHLLFSNGGGKKSRSNEMTLQMLQDEGIIEVEAITYLRGRSISNAFILIDEVQNISAHELKTIITRVGENTKIILTGDLDQIDSIYLDSINNGLAIAVDRFKEYDIASHIHLVRGERSPLASLASKIL